MTMTITALVRVLGPKARCLRERIMKLGSLTITILMAAGLALPFDSKAEDWTDYEAAPQTEGDDRQTPAESIESYGNYSEPEAPETPEYYPVDDSE